MIKQLLAITFLVFAQQISAQQFSKQVERFITEKSATFAITNVTTIDGTGGIIKENQTILINAGKIQAIGNNTSVKVPNGVKTIDGTGKTIIPGLV